MARDDWRLKIKLAEHERKGLLGRLQFWESDADELAHELKERRLAVTEDDDVVFVYASTSLELEKARAAIEQELDDLGAQPTSVQVEHWLAAEERWDDDTSGETVDSDLLAEGYAPWEVRIPAKSREEAGRLARELEREGYGVVRRFKYVIAGCSSREEAEALAQRLHGQVELGGELVWETMPGNPFAVFGGIGDAGGPI
jgi:hypothetical protein